MFESILIILLTITLAAMLVVTFAYSEDNNTLKKEVLSLNRTMEGKDIFKRHEISNLIYKQSRLREEIKILKNDKFLNEAMIEGIQKEREELKKRIEELQFEKFNKLMSEPCENPYKDDLFKCHCGSEDFIELNRSKFNGIKGVPPYVELQIQCVKCGGIHKIKDEPYSDKYSYKKSTD